MTELQKGFYQGFACACAITLKNHGENTIVKDTFMCNFMSVATMKKAGVDDFDIELLTPIVKEIERKQKGLIKTAPATDTGDNGK